ncbi:MAG: hypothetical protein H0W89_07805 [Candidatus Levybacteria bacterium]|nr:hypothetical protein [Candidatus Levybacteria bacterium]
MLDILSFFQTEGLLLIFKVLILVLIFVYIIFSFIVINRVKSLTRTINLAAAKASATLQFISVLFFFIAISLFIATIVIV